MITSVALKARIRKIWRDVSKVMYIRCRLIGSEEVWFWLARIIKGRSQQVRTRRGVERGSVAMYWFMEYQPVSIDMLRHVRLISAMIRL